MANLPDITDLLEAWKNYGALYETYETLQKKVAEAGEEISQLEEEVVRRYKAANIPEIECNHPVIRYQGLGESECACCGKCRV